MGESRGRVGLLAVLATAAMSVGAMMGRSAPPQQVEPLLSPVATSTEVSEVQRLSVHVSGMVMAPGVVVVAEGSIVADVIAAAGGLRAGAAIDRLNLAASVGQGEHIVVPGPGDDLGVGESAVVGGSESGVVSLSTATAAELETLPGVGPVLAERIVSWRDQNGPFDVVEDLLEVSGIGESKLAALRDLVRP